MLLHTLGVEDEENKQDFKSADKHIKPSTISQYCEVSKLLDFLRTRVHDGNVNSVFSGQWFCDLTTDSPKSRDDNIHISPFREDRIQGYFITNTLSMQAILYPYIKGQSLGDKNRQYEQKTKVPIDYEAFRC